VLTERTPRSDRDVRARQASAALYLGLDVGVDAAAATAEHFEIIDAVRSRDRARAHDLMVRPISHAEKRITTALWQAGL